MAHLSLANTVDAAKTLLNPVRIPRKIIVNHQMGALKINPLARGVCGNEHLHIRIMLEGLLRLHAFLAAHTAVDNYHSFFAAKQSSFFPILLPSITLDTQKEDRFQTLK